MGKNKLDNEEIVFISSDPKEVYESDTGRVLKIIKS